MQEAAFGRLRRRMADAGFGRLEDGEWRMRVREGWRINA